MKHINEDGLDLLDAMLTYNPVNRISAKKILEHKYFDGFDRKLVPTDRKVLHNLISNW